MRAFIVLAALLVGAATANAIRGPGAPSEMCDTCRTVVRFMKDAMCDPQLEGTLEDWVIDNVCPATGSKQSCADIVNGVAPALFDWLRLGTDADQMCAEAGVCGRPPALLFGAPQAKGAHRLRSARDNDMTCPLCMFVVTKVKDGLSDPVTRESIHQQTTAACNLLPGGSMREGCVNWANNYEESIFNFVETTEPSELCAMLGSCLTVERLVALRPAPLSKGAIAALMPLGQVLQERRAANGAVGNDNCDTCKVVIAEMHSALANPDLQAQITGYAKAVCDSMGSYSDTCKEHVDQYAPLAFGTVLAYLQPEQVCKQLHMCPVPSLAQQLLGLAGALMPDKFEGLLLQGHPMARLHMPRA